MPTNKRPFILTVCCLLVLLCALFPPRTFAPVAQNSPSRKFLFSSEPYLERISSSITASAPAHIDSGRFAAEVLVILSLAGIALLATTPRA
jgi:hypothetical protein